MTRADKITHLCSMIEGNAYHCWLSNMEENWGYVRRLQELANRGCFASADTLEARGLERGAMQLQKLAEDITAVREKLISNSTQPGLLHAV